MLKHGVYDQRAPLLKEKGYQVDELSTEKLKAFGYKGDEIIPMPFSVYLILIP